MTLTKSTETIAMQLEEAQVVLFAAFEKAKGFGATDIVDAVNELLVEGEKFALYLTALMGNKTDDETLVPDVISYCQTIEAIAKEL